MRFFNTYSRQIEEFEPRDPAELEVGMYTCGPTVYSRVHSEGHGERSESSLNRNDNFLEKESVPFFCELPRYARDDTVADKMPIRFFNTYSRQVEELEPRDPAARPIRIYTCGPTVYSRALSEVMVSEANHLSTATIAFWKRKACHSFVSSLATLGMTR